MPKERLAKISSANLQSSVSDEVTIRLLIPWGVDVSILLLIGETIISTLSLKVLQKTPKIP